MTDIYIRTSYATAHCAIVTTGIVANEIENSEKAIHLQAYDELSKEYRTFWLPKKALKQTWERDNMKGFELANWFRPKGYVQFIFERCASSLFTAA